MVIVGGGGGTSGKAMAFCMVRPGLNSRTDIGFLSLKLMSIYFHWVSCFFQSHEIECLLLLCFNLLSFTIVKNFKCNLTIHLVRGKNKSKKRPGKAHIFNMVIVLKRSTVVSFLFLRARITFCNQVRETTLIGRNHSMDAVVKKKWFKIGHGIGLVPILPNLFY